MSDELRSLLGGTDREPLPRRKVLHHIVFRVADYRKEARLIARSWVGRSEATTASKP